MEQGDAVFQSRIRNQYNLRSDSGGYRLIRSSVSTRMIIYRENDDDTIPEMSELTGIGRLLMIL